MGEPSLQSTPPDSASPPSDSTESGVLESTLLEATRPMVAIATRSLAKLEEQVTIVQYRALVVLASNEPCNLSALSESLDVHASTATRMCDRLVSRGYIERVRSRDSRREVQLSLTETGRDLVEVATAKRKAEISKIVEAIPECERGSAAVGIRAFIEASSKVLGASWPEALTEAAQS